MSAPVILLVYTVVVVTIATHPTSVRLSSLANEEAVFGTFVKNSLFAFWLPTLLPLLFIGIIPTRLSAGHCTAVHPRRPQRSGAYTPPPASAPPSPHLSNLIRKHPSALVASPRDEGVTVLMQHSRVIFLLYVEVWVFAFWTHLVMLVMHVCDILRLV